MSFALCHIPCGTPSPKPYIKVCRLSDNCCISFVRTDNFLLQDLHKGGEWNTKVLMYSSRQKFSSIESILNKYDALISNNTTYIDFKLVEIYLGKVAAIQLTIISCI